MAKEKPKKEVNEEEQEVESEELDSTHEISDVDEGSDHFSEDDEVELEDDSMEDL
jgi:hypothetical protein